MSSLENFTISLLSMLTRFKNDPFPPYNHEIRQVECPFQTKKQIVKRWIIDVKKNVFIAKEFGNHIANEKYSLYREY